MAALWFVGAVWLLSGVVTAVVMARRGHDPIVWVLMPLVLGPAAPFLAVRAAKAETASRATLVAPGRPGAGAIAALAAIDGSREALDALRSLIRLHGPAIGRLTLASVVPFDTEDVDAAQAVLAEAAQSIAPLTPGQVVLRGEPSSALASAAAQDRYDLLVIGHRGRGRSSLPLGSVAARLAGGAPVAVLIGPAHTPSKS